MMLRDNEEAAGPPSPPAVPPGYIIEYVPAGWRVQGPRYWQGTLAAGLPSEEEARRRAIEDASVVRVSSGWAPPAPAPTLRVVKPEEPKMPLLPMPE